MLTVFGLVQFDLNYRTTNVNETDDEHADVVGPLAPVGLLQVDDVEDEGERTTKLEHCARYDEAQYNVADGGNMARVVSNSEPIAIAVLINHVTRVTFCKSTW